MTFPHDFKKQIRKELIKKGEFPNEQAVELINMHINAIIAIIANEIINTVKKSK